MAPDLHSVIRELLQRKQIPPESIDTYIKNLPSPQRYDSAFKALWRHCVAHKVNPVDLSVDQLAAQLLLLNKVNSSQAKHAYASMLLVPGFENLKFSPF